MSLRAQTRPSGNEGSISQARVSQVERGEIHNLETMRSYAAALGARITVSIEYGDRRLGAA
ncbi:hypothetical protein RM572_21235 [Streptomyces sp. DSM 42041]|uniref:XRE family transcriptional regulator n=1 Tax=Streptomyces hazeniae TaxID=3075538 RepID=A0ABU2NWB2_9ACTN|nr:hypothetical protein [Streptomyces sp. DSM 42041]MDT0381285.1 hypothetical protein [Streptomyces sp. DSM 42041]